MKKQLRITVNGKTFDVVAEVIDQAGQAAAAKTSSRPSAAKPAAAESSAESDAPKAATPAASGSGGELLSPLAGKVVSIDKAVGSSVEEGETVVTLEAMKMNTVVQADRSGKIEKVLVEPGDAVEEGQGLLIIS